MAKKIHATQSQAGLRLDKLLFQEFGISFSIAQKLIREKKIRVNGARVDKAYKINVHDEIDIYENIEVRIKDEKIKPTVSKEKITKFLSYIIYEDENMVAINKPSGLAVQGRSISHSSIDDLLYSLKKVGKDFHLVHRIDRDTSGILLMAKNKNAAAILTECFKGKTISKTYQALVLGDLKKDEGEINIPLLKKKVGESEKVYPDFIDGKEAISKFKVKKRFGDFTFVELQPITGRTHQLRVHTKEIGHPIIGDVKYGGQKVIMKNVANRLCLHAYKIEIDNYFGAKLVIEAPRPDFLKKK